MQDLEVAKVAQDDELPEVWRALTLAFGIAPDRAEAWIRGAGLEHLRVAREREGEPIVGCLLRIPMGQFFGGRSVPMLGFAGVAVLPEARGHGVARRMMAAALREARPDFPLAGLFASTHGLYRQVGFERAGHWCRYRVPLASLARPRFTQGPRALKLAPLAPEHRPAMQACYRAFALGGAGMLDRGPYCWSRVEVFRGTPHHGYGLFAPDGTLEAYAWLNQRVDMQSLEGILGVTDLAFSTPRGARELLEMLFSFATISQALEFHGGPVHPLLLLLGEPSYSVTVREYSFARIVDPARALELRGYPAGLRAELTFELDDATLRDNAGVYNLQIADSRARVTRGKAAAAPLRTDVRGLACLYTGFLPPGHARTLGLVEGPDEAVHAAAAVFAGPTPWMTEMF